ncbi:MAG: (2Fe-2S)-binding protein [Caldisericia bacterium]|nr:(2Fe-2S)-binding protein [Caldisericia bacterium]
MKLFEGYIEKILNINGETKKVLIKPNETLLRVIREKLGLTGTKIGCENGDCGACTILINDIPYKSCMVLAIELDEKDKITTIEGIDDEKIKNAFIEEEGFQCGFCTSGFIVNVYSLLKKYKEPDDETIKEYLESNLCRCTGYDGIEKAVKKVLQER